MCGKSGGERIVHKPALRVCDMGGGSMTSGKVPAKAFAVFAVALMMLSVLPMINVSAPEADGYNGDSYYVVYHPGQAIDSSSINTNEIEDYKSIKIRYYGTPVAEYNPQFWTDNNRSVQYINGEVLTNSLTNWNEIIKYQNRVTTVFTGWYLADDSGNIISNEPIDPGTDLTALYSQNADVIHLVATWDKANVKFYWDDVTDLKFDEGTKYTNIAVLTGETYFRWTMDWGYKWYNNISNCTIRSDVDKTVTLRLKTYELLEIEREDYLNLNGPVIIDNIRLKGYSTSTSQDIYGLYANFNSLIIGTNVSTTEGSNNYVQVFGGSPTGNSNHSLTDVRIFSGTYSNVVAGGGGSGNNDNGGYRGTISNTSVVLAGNTKVLESVLGASVKDSKVTNTSVLVAGNAEVCSNSYDGDVLVGGFSTVIGGSRFGDVTGQTDVAITGNAVVFAVQGGGRDSTSTTQDTSVTVSGRATVSLVCGSLTDGRPEDGNHSDLPVQNTYVHIKDSAYVASVYGGGWDIYGDPALPSTASTRVEVSDFPVIGVIFGGGYRGDIGVSGSQAVTITIHSGTIGAVYGGGRGGPDPLGSSPGMGNTTGSADVNGDVSISILGGTVDSTAYDKLAEHSPELSDGSNYTFNKNILVKDVIVGNVYGGGFGVIKDDSKEGRTWTSGGKSIISNGTNDSAMVTGDVTISIGPDATINGSVFGGGKGVGTTGYEDVARIDGNVTVNIEGVTVNGDVYGGGQYSRSVVPDVALVVLGSGTVVNGNVHGGGMGGTSDALMFGDRTVIVNGATVNGNVYGGSRIGSDGAIDTDTDQSGTKESRVLVIAGVVMQGIYGGGFEGKSDVNAYVLIGTPAVEYAYREHGILPAMSSNDSIGLRINSVYGGGNLDPSSFNSIASKDGIESVFDQELVLGDAHVEIGSYATDLGSIHFPGYRPSQPGEPSNAVKISIYGDIIGAGNFSDVHGTKEIYIHGYEQNNVYNIKSIQRADEVIIEQSDIAVDGSVDAQSSQLTKLLSINRVGTLILDRSNIDLYHETMNIDEYRSLVDGNPAGRGDCLILNGEVSGNRVVLHDGVMFDIRGSGDNNGTVEGYTLLTRPGGDMYYGAFAVSYGVASGVPETGFMVGDGTEEASLLISSSSGAYIWYIAGYYTLNEQLNFSETGSWKAAVDFAFPKMSSESHFEYMGGYVDPVVQDGVVITNEVSDYVNFTNTLEQSPTGDVLTEMVGSRMIFGMTLSETIGSVTEEAAVALHTFNTGTKQFERQFGTGSSDNPVVSEVNKISLNATLLSSDYYKQGYGTSGSLGTVMIHLAEVLDNEVPVNMIDLRVSIYVEPVEKGDNVIDLFVTVMSSGSGRGRGYIDLPSTALPMYYYFDSISDDGGVSKLTMWSDMTHLGINGWNSIVYSDVGKLLTIMDDEGTLNSQTYLGQGSGVRTSTLAFDYEGDPEASFTITLVDRQSQDGENNTTYKVHVTVKPVSNIELDIAFRPLSSDGWKYLNVVSGDGSSSGKAYTLQWRDSKQGGMMTLPYGTVLSTDCAWFVLDLTAFGGTQSTPKYMTYQEAFEAMLDFSVNVEGSDEPFNYKDNLYGWFINEDLKTKYRMSSPAKENMTLHAGCAIEVRFHGEGVTVSPTTIYVSPGYKLSQGYNNLSFTDSEKISIYNVNNGDGRDGFHLHKFDGVLSWATKTDSGWSLYNFDTHIYDDLDLYLPWDPNEYSITVTVDPNGYADDLHISVDGVEKELEDGKVTIAYTQGVVLDMYVDGDDGTEYPYRITSALLSYGGKEISVGQTGLHSISFDMPNIGSHGTDAELELSVLRGYTITVELYDGKGSTLPGTGLNVIVDGTTENITSSIKSVMFTKEDTGNLGEVVVGFSIDGKYHWAVWASTDGVSYSGPSARNTDSYTISDMQSDVYLKVAVYSYVQIESIGQGIGSVNASWEGANETVNIGSTVYEGDSLVITPKENFTLPIKSSSGVVQVGNTFTFTVTGKSDVVLGDLTEVEKAMTITVVLKDGDVMLDGISDRLTLTISGPGGDVSSGILWTGAPVNIDYNTPSSGLVKGHIDGFYDVQGTVSWDGLTLEFQIIHYMIQYVGPDGEILSGSDGVTEWTVAAGPVAPSYGSDGQFTAVAVSDSDDGTYQVWLQDDRTLVRTIGVGLFSMSQTLTLYAIPPLEGGGADTNETIVVAVESNHVNGWHSVPLEADGEYTVVLGDDTITFDLEPGAEGEDGVVTITGYPEGKYVGTISFILGDVTLVLKVVPGTSGSGSGQGALT